MSFVDHDSTAAPTVIVGQRYVRRRLTGGLISAMTMVLTTRTEPYYPRFDREARYIREWRRANAARSIDECRRLARLATPRAHVARACLINYRLLKQPPVRFAFYQGSF